MAYSATVKITRQDGSRFAVVEVTEEEATSTDAWSTEASDTNRVYVNGKRLPVGDKHTFARVGAVTEIACRPTGGSATTVQPRAGTKAAWTDADDDALFATGPASAREHTVTRVPYSRPKAFVLHGASAIDSDDGDSTVFTRLCIEESL